MEFKDYYATLGVARDADEQAVKQAFRRLARRYHPDVSSEANAEERFKEVQEAYEVLKDPEKRAAYDQFGARWREAAQGQPPPDWDRMWREGPGVGSGFSGFEGASEFSDFFETLFGRGHRAGRGGRMRGEDRHARVSIPLEDAYHGTTRTLTLEHSVAGADGGGTRTLNVKIPAGVTEGQQIRLAGQGGSGLGDAPSGDLYLEVSFAPHRLFRAEGRNVVLDLPVTPWEAALGETVTVPTLGGKVDLRIPAGARSGAKLRLAGRGLPGSPPGDQYVVLSIVVPKAETQAELELYMKMKREMAFNPRTDLGV